MFRPWRHLALLAAATSAGVVVSCSKPTTITLVITSDVPCADLRGVSIAAGTVADVDTREASTSTLRCSPQGSESRVGSLVIVPRNANDSELSIRVVGGLERAADECTAQDGFAGCIVARRLLRFVPETELVVTVALRAACKSVSCDTTSTCVRGECRSASLDPGRCTGGGCDETSLGNGGPATAVDASLPEASTLTDGGVATPVPCGPNEKSCDDKCVAKNDPAYGCSDGVCITCAGAGVASSVCEGMECKLQGCVAGYKLCAGNCVPADAQHGCSSASCAPCESTNGTPTCDSSSACTIVCSPGTKLCGGKCVSNADPTYGCTATGCGAAGCPDPGSGTLVCTGGSCVVGACGADSKQCGAVCVPKDAHNGCATIGRCTPCAAGEACTGSPSACTCVPDSLATTCATKACGSTLNNCGQTVTCPNTCVAPTTCNGGGAGGNGCGCTPDNVAACAGKACGPAVNSCGQTIQCPNTCPSGYGCGASGAGPNACGCVPDNVAACTGKACGPATNNCGQAITCPDNCTGYNKCGGGSAGPNGCGCTPRTTCYEPCGTFANGCGGYYHCGPTNCVPR